MSEIGENWLNQEQSFLALFLLSWRYLLGAVLLEYSDARLIHHIIDNFLQIAGFLEDLQLRSAPVPILTSGECN